MILQALYEYYQRKAADPESNIAPEGWEWKEIPFVIVIDKSGEFVGINDTREGAGNKKRARRFLVPQPEKRASGIKACLLWDNIEYALGANPRERGDIQARHQAFLTRMHELPKKILTKQPLSALQAFLDSGPVKQIERSKESKACWDEAKESNAFIVFKVDKMLGETIFDSLRDELAVSGREDASAICMITGKNDSIARLHPPVKGIRDANTTGASLVSFNLSAFCSYGKSQNYNAQIGNSAAFAYTTALNTLLGRDSQNKFHIGDASVVFWAAKTESGYAIESDFGWFFNQPPKDDPDRGVTAVRNLFQAVKSGALPHDEGNRFYVLGLSPNAARISVRFWKVGTVRQFAEKIIRHFEDLEIIKGPQDSEFLTLNQLLTATVFEYKSENIPPNLAGKVVESVLDGTPYPATLLQQCIRRIRAEHHVNYKRAAILKACLNRRARSQKRNDLEVHVSLDKKNSDPGYRIGRLFAVLEKIQEEAQPGINATIRDRYYGAASSSPVTVFPQLLKLKNHHLAKLHPGRKANMEKEIGEIMDGVADFPPHLSMESQARFAIGYYHQRQDFFTRKDADTTKKGVE